MAEKKVLVIVHDFPPLGGGAVMRVLKFAKYLPAFGWKPIVVTLREEYYPRHVIDETLLAEIPRDVRIYRTNCLKPKAVARATITQRAAQGHDPIASFAVSIKRWLSQNLMVFKDEGFLWFPYAILAIRTIARREHFNAILTSSPPHNVHLLGLWAKRFTGKPWIVDFRDGWTDDALFRSQLELRNALERYLERTVIRYADFVISATDRIDDWFRDRYGTDYGNKAALIYNGFDPLDFESITSIIRPENAPARLNIVYTGSAGGRRNIRPFLEALTQLAQDSEVPPESIRVEFVGTLGSEDLAMAKRTPGVVVTPFQSHAGAIQKMLSADVLLVVNAIASREALTGKLFEYIAAGRPVLALTHPGLLSRLIESEKLGWSVVPDDCTAIKSLLKELLQLKKNGTLTSFGPSPEFVARFDRRQATQRLADILNLVTQQNKLPKNEGQRENGHVEPVH